MTGLLSNVSDSDFSGLSYQPKTRETKAVFEVKSTAFYIEGS